MYWLRTFGGLAVDRDGSPLERVVAHRKALALLSVLAFRGRVGRESLTALLWQDSDAERARGSLNQALHILRRELESPDLFLGTTELRLNPDLIDSDVASFLRAFDAGDLPRAVEHYGGAFLDGVHVAGAPDFERWIETRRLDLERRYHDALERLAMGAEAEADFAAAAAWWQRLQESDPLNSRVAVHLMMALDRSGDRAAALKQARIHESILRDEWGIEPDAAVSALALQLQSGIQAAPSPLIGKVRRADASADDVRDIREPTVRGSASAAGRPWMKRAIAAGLVVMIGLAGIVVMLSGGRDRGAAQPGKRDVVAASTSSVDARSIAVLPFLDLSPQRDHEYLSDGFTAELIAALSRVEGLKVVARNSSFQFKMRNPDIRDVGRLLGVAFVLEGSVRRDEDGLRVAAQLVSTEDGYHRWSESFGARSEDIFTMQEEMAAAITRALGFEIAAVPADPSDAVKTESFAAYEHYLRGLHFFNRLQIAQAIEHLRGATAEDPDFARAYAALAEAYAVPAAYGNPAITYSRENGVAAARRALELDPTLSEAHAALGWLELVGFRWNESQDALERALELDPVASRAMFYHAMLLHRRGMRDSALEQIRRARELDPLSLPVNALFGSFLGDVGRSDEAIAHLQATLELDPHFPISHAVLAHVYLGTGRTAEAITHYERAAELVPTSYYAGFLGHAYARSGRRGDAARILDSLDARSGRGEAVSPGAVGWILLAAGEDDAGYAWLGRAVDEHDPFLTVYGILSNAFLADQFDGDARFRDIRRRVGLEEG